MFLVLLQKKLKKLSQGFSHNRSMPKKPYKSKLDKIVESVESDSFTPTLIDCHKWFNILNRELFNNELPPVDEMDIRWRRQAHAYYVFEDNENSKDYGCTKIALNKEYKSKKFFVECLAHEMVHHWQFVNGEKVNHGKMFKSWDRKLKQKGIKI